MASNASSGVRPRCPSPARDPHSDDEFALFRTNIRNHLAQETQPGWTDLRIFIRRRLTRGLRIETQVAMTGDHFATIEPRDK